MTGLVEAVREKIMESCIEDGPLRRKDCEISLEDAPQPRVVIDFDKPGSPLGKSQRRCEYLFVADGDGGGGWVVPMEFKSSRIRVSKVAEQLRAGARAAERLVPNQNPISFRPVAVVYEQINKKQRKDLKDKSNAVRYRGCCEPIRVLLCSALLTGVLGA